jgi:hypothetical protein
MKTARETRPEKPGIIPPWRDAGEEKFPYWYRLKKRG